MDWDGPQRSAVRREFQQWTSYDEPEPSIGNQGIIASEGMYIDEMRHFIAVIGRPRYNSIHSGRMKSEYLTCSTHPRRVRIRSAHSTDIKLLLGLGIYRWTIKEMATRARERIPGVPNSFRNARAFLRLDNGPDTTHGPRSRMLDLKATLHRNMSITGVAPVLWVRRS